MRSAVREFGSWDEDRAADLQTFVRTADLWEFVEEFIALHPATPIVLPSGFGIPVTRVGEILDQDIVEMTLEPIQPTADGLGQFLAEARRRSLRAFCIPAVKLLPSVPPQRKLNRVDLGTSDALCSAAWALHTLEATGRAHAACDFVLVHTRTRRRGIAGSARPAARGMEGPRPVPPGGAGPPGDEGGLTLPG